MTDTPAVTGPKVSIGEVRAAVKSETFTVLPDGRTTVCQITMDNGFTVTGVSACLSEENYDKEEAEAISRSRAMGSVCSFLAFRLADKIMKETA